MYRAAHLMDISDRQGFLEIDDVIDKYELLLDFLEDELEIAKVEKKINRKVRESIDKGQKEYYLREQIKAIQEELGDEDDDDLLLKADKLPIPEESKKNSKGHRAQRENAHLKPRLRNFEKLFRLCVRFAVGS